MDPFSISCTTCHARLKVRDAGAVGQILPCPKCGSMVLVEQPASPSPPAEAPKVSAAAAAPIPGAESFDAIDQLLDDTPPQSTTADERWRGQEETTESSQDVGQSKNVGEDEPVENDTVAEPVGDSADWWSTSSAVAQKYALLMGGLAIGAGIAITVAGYVFTRSDPTPPTLPATPEPVAVAEETKEPQPSEPPLENPTPEESQTIPSEVEVADQVEVTGDEPPSQPEATIPKDEPAEVATIADEPSEPTEEATSAPETDNTLINPGDDGLAGFAQWLQDTEAAPAERNSTPAADELPPAEPVTRQVTPQTRPIPDKVDVDARLKDELIALEFKDVSLNSALRTLSSFSTIPITVDPDALGRRNLTAGHKVNLLIRNKSSVGDVLSELLERFRLDYYVADGHLFVSTPAECAAEFVSIPHDVSDLANGDNDKVQAFGQWIQQLVAQGTWLDQDGRGQCRAAGTKLEITHFDTVHYQVLSFCERLRLVRDQKPITKLRPEHITTSLRANSLRAAGKPVTLKIWRESNLESIAAEFENAAEMQVLIDWHALHSAGWSPEDVMTFFCRNQPVEQAMVSLLEPMGLTYRVVNPLTIQISTHEALEAQHEIEFYPLPENATSDEMTRISQRIVQRIGQAKFQPAGRGTIGFDTHSRSLIVSLPQHDQVIVHALLSQDAANER